MASLQQQGKAVVTRWTWRLLALDAIILPEGRSTARIRLAQLGSCLPTECAGTNLREDCDSLRAPSPVTSLRHGGGFGWGLCCDEACYGCSSYSHTVVRNGQQGYSVAEPPMR